MVDVRKQILKLKSIIAIAIHILLAGIIILELYREEQDDQEEYYVEKVYSKDPKNMNTEAYMKF